MDKKTPKYGSQNTTQKLYQLNGEIKGTKKILFVNI